MPKILTDPQGRVRLYSGNCLRVLERLPARSVHCVVTSPPYWGQRDYGAGEGEIGSEPTADGFLASMVALGRGVRRVLRDDGVFWLNLGDTYAVASGNLLGMPWRSALALQADGWDLICDLPWVKRSAMPDPCERRPGKALEYVFMLTKGTRYYFDMQAVRTTRNFRQADLWFASVNEPHGMVGVGDEMVGLDVTNPGYKGAHFATYPPRLIEPLIRASTAFGVCSRCGTQWQRVVSKREGERVAETDQGNRDRSLPQNRNGITGSLDGKPAERITVGWEAGCRCQAPPIPATVLDPFNGSGTTAATAVGLGRHAIGIDLNEAYLTEHAIPRISRALSLPQRDVTNARTLVHSAPDAVPLFEE